MRAFLILLLLTACGHEPGATPLSSDGDGDLDYLSDAEEAELGTDPMNPDTDGDTYLDGDEILEGSDPRDANSRIYEGGWPYQRFKDEITDPGFGSTAEIGAVVPRLRGVDQFGQVVDLYDFSGHGKPLVIDLSAGWCAACREVADWLEGGGSLGDDPAHDSIVEMVRDGSVHWITILFEDATSTPANADDVRAWYEAYPNPHVPVIADDDRALSDWFWPGAYPALFVVNDDMTIRVYDRYDYVPALDSLVK